MMEVVFRADASVRIGTGHVMRCLTLADALRSRGARARFVCRTHPGHLLEVIRRRGYEALELHARDPAQSEPADEHGSPYAGWFGTSWEADAEQTLAVLGGSGADWLVVDHYALDARWEMATRPCYRNLLAIDDLADRPHACDLLLDQNLGRTPADYDGLVPRGCTVLAGARYALLRPRFAELRDTALRRPTALRRLLVTMGGVDKDNVTGQVLDALRSCALPSDVQVTAVLGARAPWLDEVSKAAGTMPWPTEVLVDVADMAALLADVDLAIGAAGTSAWERCCMGVPTLTFAIADNQRPGARALQAEGAALFVESPAGLAQAIDIVLAPGVFQAMRQACAAVTDGRGAERVAEGLQRVRA